MTTGTSFDLITAEDLQQVAQSYGICSRPIARKVTDIITGVSDLVTIPCGATQARICPACADKARKLRIQQCREGWHRTSEPEDESAAVDELDVEEWDRVDDEPSRRVRSTRRREDVPDLPKVPMSGRTVGRAFTTPDGKTYRPSMFLTLTLPSYGRVRKDGTPVDPDSYDYHRAAMDALHFPRLVDRFWQNLRRCAGYHAQYFACVEAQRRLAPHLHAAVRGVIPRAVVRQVAAATYHQLWWPQVSEPVYDGDRLPVWDELAESYVDPDTGVLLPIWEEAIDALGDDPDPVPGHVLRLGRQVDYQGIIVEAEHQEARSRRPGLSLAHRLPDVRGVVLSWPAWSRHRWAGAAQKGLLCSKQRCPPDPTRFGQSGGGHGTGRSAGRDRDGPAQAVGDDEVMTADELAGPSHPAGPRADAERRDAADLGSLAARRLSAQLDRPTQRSRAAPASLVDRHRLGGRAAARTVGPVQLLRAVRTAAGRNRSRVRPAPQTA